LGPLDSTRPYPRGRGSRDEPVKGARPAASLHLVKRYHVTTFGCQMNEHDSERMKGMLDALGYVEAPAPDEADVILFNTCSIREKADSRFLAHLGHAKRLKLEDPARIVGVGGCWAQSVKDEVFERFPFVDVAFGPGQVPKLAEFLTSDSLTAQGFFEFEGFTGHLPGKRAREFQAWVQIFVGCNCNCSYCIAPSVIAPCSWPWRTAARSLSWRPFGPTTSSTSASISSWTTPSPTPTLRASRPSLAAPTSSPRASWTCGGSGL